MPNDRGTQGGESGAELVGEPAGKKVKREGGARRPRGKRGALQKISDMPLDIIGAICSHLGSGDLLSLTMTSKSFRAFLTTSSAELLWREVRRKEGLPELTAGDLNSMQYAQLIWGRKCCVCGKRNITKLQVWLRVRLCPSCKKTSIVSTRAYENDRRFKNFHHYVRSCTPRSKPTESWQSPAGYFVPHLISANEYLRGVESDLREDCIESDEVIDEYLYKEVQEKKAWIQCIEEDAVALEEWIMAKKAREAALKPIRVDRTFMYWYFQ